MTCKTCGRNSITGESQCGDCQPRQIVWPERSWLKDRLALLKAQEERNDE